MSNISIFYLVFIVQIVLLTIYYPRKIVKRMRTIQNNYPQSTHPKLYPKSSHYYTQIANMYVGLNVVILGIGLVVIYLVSTGRFMDERGVNTMLPWFYFMLQMIPMWLINILGFRMTKLMRLKDSRTERSADLSPRGFFSYVSPKLLSAVILSYVAFVLFVFYLADFEFDVEGKAFLMSVILLAGYAFFFIMSAVMIYGRKTDPYQKQADRFKAISFTIKTYCFTMISCAVFLSTMMAFSTFELKSIMPVAMSIFLQFIVVISMGYMLQKFRLEDIDFDVYKQG